MGFNFFLANLGLGIFGTFMGFSMGGVWNSLYMLQIISLLPVMAFHMPSCVFYFLDYYSFTNGKSEYLGSWLRNTICRSEVPVYMEAPYYTFEKAGFPNVLFVDNAADTLTIVALACLIVPIVSIVTLMLPKAEMISNLDHFFRRRFAVGMLNFAFLKLTMLACLNFYHFNPDTESAGFSSFTSIGAIVLLGCVPIFYIFHGVWYARELRSLKKKMQYAEVFAKDTNNEENKLVMQNKAKIIRSNFRAKILFEEYNTSSPFQYMYILWFLTQRIGFACIMAFMYTMPEWQFFGMGCITGVHILYLAWF